MPKTVLILFLATVCSVSSVAHANAAPYSNSPQRWLLSFSGSVLYSDMDENKLTDASLSVRFGRWFHSNTDHTYFSHLLLFGGAEVGRHWLNMNEKVDEMVRVVGRFTLPAELALEAGAVLAVVSKPYLTVEIYTDYRRPVVASTLDIDHTHIVFGEFVSQLTEFIRDNAEVTYTWQRISAGLTFKFPAQPITPFASVGIERLDASLCNQFNKSAQNTAANWVFISLDKVQRCWDFIHTAPAFEFGLEIPSGRHARFVLNTNYIPAKTPVLGARLGLEIHW